MMQLEQEPYWQDDRLLGEGRFQGEPTGLRLRVHLAHEEHFGREELIPLRHPTGTRTYVQARPYVLVPEITLTVATNALPPAEGAIGEVVAAEWEGLRHLEIGNAQAWFYPLDQVVMLWECALFERYAQPHPSEDPSLQTLWSGFEQVLTDYFPHARRIVTPSWEDMYEREVWQQFLRERGYQPRTPRVFAKAWAAAR